MSEFYPENDLNHYAPESVMSRSLRRSMQHDSLRVLFERTPKAVIGGNISFPHRDEADHDYLVIVSKYDADVHLPSTDGSFYDIHVMLKNDTRDYMARYVLSDLAASNAEPYWPLRDETLHTPLTTEGYQSLGDLLAYVAYSDEATEEAIRHLEWWRIVEPQGTLDGEQPDMAFYDLTSVLKQEWGGAA